MRVTVMGLGLFGGGAGAVRYFSEKGDDVLVTDLRQASDLEPTLDALSDLQDVRYVLGEHRQEDFQSSDLIVVNPAVAETSRFLDIARKTGVELTTEMNLFLQHCPAPILAVTGSNGKTTTAHMLLDLLLIGEPGTRMAGNMGCSLLPEVDSLDPTSPIVLEISSFQLAWVPRDIHPFQGAIITNITPNHLDRHGSFDHYVATKKKVVAALQPGAPLVLNHEDPILADWVEGGSLGEVSVLLTNGSHAPTPAHLVGHHQGRNLSQATLMALTRNPGLKNRDIGSMLSNFRPLPHRLEILGNVDGVDYVNDSKATTPEATMAALRSFDMKRVVLIAGGSEKGLGLDPLALTAAGCRSVETIGTSGPALAGKIKHFGGQARFHENLKTAVSAATKNALPDGVVLLSPGHASYGEFNSYVQRGQEFRRIVLGTDHAPEMHEEDGSGPIFPERGRDCDDKVNA